MERGNNQSDFDSLIINYSNVYRIKPVFQHYLIKIFNYLKQKVIIKKKKITSYDIDNLREQHSDNESDETSYEKFNPQNTSRKSKSIFCNNYSNNNIINTDINNESKTLYLKKINSMNIIRNNDTIDYDVVLTYQKYVPKRIFNSGTLFDTNTVKNNISKICS
jgi:hypothetical protein